ncbi:MAG: HAD family phosphatase [Pseudomonadota bacterium]
MHRPALLFDLDGTLIDSDPLHARVFKEMFAERGIAVDEAFYVAEIHGRHNSEIFAKHCPDEDAHALHLLKEAAYRDLLPGLQIDPTPGAVELLSRAGRAGWSVAVVTNAPRMNAEASLDAIGLLGAFDTTVIGEECERGKPDPAPYLHALELLGATPENTIAFEDSASGIASAVGAGLRTIGLTSSLSDEALRAAGAAASIQNFHDTALGPELARLEGELT